MWNTCLDTSLYHCPSKTQMSSVNLAAQTEKYNSLRPILLLLHNGYDTYFINYDEHTQGKICY